ncbi:hypothetical protein GCM10011418_16460 [Sphingobacterium alkalisoli]|uniref:hypothetical protein n=1 Tax=Sphingobacterium alkalisoli TaxID=1874115 RepID=UPI0019BE15E2|nr:hypothetical protein [Sphingobacterium alkalisoli]GGH15054.1 hypothetical protein GCM10011418_16460 [Sphingobacterium alkalisoli]
MDKETAKYLVTYFFRLLPDEEKLAWKHHSSILKLESNDNPKAMEVYKRKGWITDEKKILDLLIEGYDKFEERNSLFSLSIVSKLISLKCKNMMQTK